MKSNKINFFDSVIYFFYRYYEGRFGPKSTLFEAKIAFSTLILLILVVILYYINYFTGYDLTNFVLKLNLFFVFAIIAMPSLLIIHIFTIKLKTIESLKEKESENIRKTGKKNLIILVIVILGLWAIRMIEYYLF